MPMATCPHCNQEVQLDDYYEFKTGDVRHCPNCDKEMHVLSVECEMIVALGTEREED